MTSYKIPLLKKYYYKLLLRYLNVYIRKDDICIEIDAYNNFIQPVVSNYSSINSNLIKQIKSKKSPIHFVLNTCIHICEDIQDLLINIHNIASPSDRLYIIYCNSLWKPFIQIGKFFGFKESVILKNWISPEDLLNFSTISNYEIVREERKILFPIYIPFISNFFNRYIAPLPILNNFCLLNIAILRPIDKVLFSKAPSVSILVAARNEAGNIENIVKRVPKMGPDDEIIFVEGNSSDNTWEVIQSITKKYSSKKNILCAQQDGKGKGDAVRKACSMASKEIFMILDADNTVPPEDLPRFYKQILENKGEFINGSRLVYPMEQKSMRFFNIIGNKFFALAFSFVLGQRFKDTLCANKVMLRSNYELLVNNRSYFGDFDPFGDFDWILGASRMNLKIVEIPVHYKERVYGSTNISRWSAGVLLLRMVIFAAKKIKFV